jgi:PilZ domain
MKEALSGSGDPAAPSTAIYREEASTGPKQRRSGRLIQAVPILLIGTDDDGRVFSEETHAVVLSRYGAGIVSRQKFVAEQELILRILKSGREAEVRVVGEIGDQQDLHIYGVTFVNEEGNFWQVEFPPPPSWRPVGLILECGSCKQIVELKDGDFEYDICAIHGGLARFCNECGLLTVWRRSTAPAPVTKEKNKTAGPREQVTVEPANLAPAPQKTEEFVTLADAMEGVERRARVRVKVNFCACVRTEAFGDDLVQCVDMSRGGVCFRSSHTYHKGMSVLIAVPFSAEAKDAPAIFVRGRIAHVEELADEGVHRCGVEFMR